MKENKLLVFDVDGTLCEINQEIGAKLSETLVRLSTNNQIVFSSGKPCGYLAGFVRQLGLSNCVLVGENGASIMYTATFPPASYYQIDQSNEIINLFGRVKDEYKGEFGSSIWFQPNDINVTVFPIDILRIDEVHSFSKRFCDEDIDIYLHKDSVDFVPKGFDKGTAVDLLLDKLHFNRNDLYVFGDGENDYAMLEKTKNSITINNEKFDSLEKLNGFKELAEYLTKEFLF